MGGLMKMVEFSLLVLKVLVVVVCLIALTVAGWLVEREINWRLGYEQKVEKLINEDGGDSRGRP